MTRERTTAIRQEEGNCHITKEQFCDWLAGELPPDEEAEFLGHIGNCTFCAGQFANWMESPPEGSVGQPSGWMESPPEDAVLQPSGWMESLPEDSGNQIELTPQISAVYKKMPEPPVYLKEEILQRTQQIDVQMTVRVKERSRQMQLFMYSLKVGMAVVTSIFLLLLTTNIQSLQPEDVRNWRMEQKEQRQERQEERISLTDTLNRKSGEVSSFLNEISNGLFRMGIEDKEYQRNQEVTR